MPLYDVCGIGNAIVDILAPCEEQFLIDYNIERGAMTLIDQDRAKLLQAAQGNKSKQVSGGSAANTMAGIASFGGKGAYIGLVANDPLGQVFTNDIHDLGIAYSTPPYIQGLDTARSYIFFTPYGERSMNTFLGACTELSIEHINSFMIENSSVTYMEGYLFDKDPAKEAFYKATEIAKAANKKVSLTLSDSFCVHRHKQDFINLVVNHIDILFGNEPELSALYDTDDIDEAMKKASEKCDIVVSTRGAKGVFIVNNKVETFIPAHPVDNVIDLTGAGDQMAAGVLYGLTQNKDIKICGLYGVKAAAEVISHIGPRPQISYKDFIDE